MSDIKNILESLSNAHGVSGYEGDIRKLIEIQVKPYVDEIKTDKFGNLIAIKKGGSPKLMLAAHMDEIGLMVKYIDEKGFIRFTQTGGWFDQTLLNQRMVLHTEKGIVYGVIGSKPPHLMKPEDRKKIINSEDMFIDIGAKNPEDAAKLGVKIGTPITSDMTLKELGNNMITGKALDNRAGCAMLIHALKNMQNVKATIYAVFTVQEEVGLKGAKVSAFAINPDLAIATDVTITGDHPGVDKKESCIEIGKGPAVTISDADGRGIIVNQRILKWLEDAAKTNKIPYQLEVGSGGTTDATAIHLTREGIPTGVISMPTRYIHTPVSVLSLDDLEKSSQLISKSAEIVEKYF